MQRHRTIAVALGCIVAFGTSAASARADGAPACGSGARAVSGRLQAAGPRAHVGILPDSALSESYLGELRTILAARRSPDAALDLVVRHGEFASTAAEALAQMRRVPVAADGSFRCAGLPPGRYLTVAFVSADADASRGLDPRTMHVFAASATIGANFDAAIVGWTDLGGLP